MAGYNHFSQIADALHEELVEVVEQTAKEIAEDVQQFAPVATGFLRASVYTSTWNGGSTYGEGGYGDVGQHLLPEVDRPGNDLEAYVAVGATYGAYVEFGTRFMAPQPYFYPAVDMARIPFEQALSEIDDRLRVRMR